MRILQVVNHISPDGAYGGPMRVAINQSKALRDSGHEVTVTATASGFADPMPQQFDGAQVKLFGKWQLAPKAGFSGMVSPQLLSWWKRQIKQADIIHAHMSRDLITLPAAHLALRAKKPLIVQTHGMIDGSDKYLAKPLDKLLTIPTLQGAHSVLYLTARERKNLEEVAGQNIRLRFLPNGVRIPSELAVEQTLGPQGRPEVLFLARMHARKRPMRIINAANRIKELSPTVRYSLIGPDGGEGATLRAAMRDMPKSVDIQWLGPLSPENTLTRMQEASVFVLPSINEPFPMGVLEAMSIGLPVIVTESCGLAKMVRENHAGLVCGLSQQDFDSALENILLNHEMRIKMGSNARQAVSKLHSISKVATSLEQIYESVLDRAV